MQSLNLIKNGFSKNINPLESEIEMSINSTIEWFSSQKLKINLCKQSVL